MTKPRKIVLIGTDHNYQKLGPPFQLEDPENIRLGHAQDFQRYLFEVCPQYGIKTVAEEMNKQALDEAKEKWKTRKKALERKNPRVWLPDDLEGNKAKLKRCEEALEWHEKGMSIPQRVAKELSLKPLPCDPNRGQRTKLGIFNENDLRIQPFLNSNPPCQKTKFIAKSWKDIGNVSVIGLNSFNKKCPNLNIQFYSFVGQNMWTPFQNFSKKMISTLYAYVTIGNPQFQQKVNKRPHYPMKRTSILGPSSSHHFPERSVSGPEITS